MKKPLDDAYLEALALSVRRLVDGADPDAIGELTSLAYELPKQPMPRHITPRLAWSIWARDRYSCRYCGNRVIPGPASRAAALVWPSVIPYNLNFRTDATHPVHVWFQASIDHEMPHAHGGTDDFDNLVTSCWPCNVQKGDYTLEQLGWDAPTENTRHQWDGLSGSYPQLWELARPLAKARMEPVDPAAFLREEKYHLKWIRALQSASQI